MHIQPSVSHVKMSKCGTLYRDSDQKYECRQALRYPSTQIHCQIRIFCPNTSFPHKTNPAGFYYSTRLQGYTSLYMWPSVRSTGSYQQRAREQKNSYLAQHVHKLLCHFLVFDAELAGMYDCLDSAQTTTELAHFRRGQEEIGKHPEHLSKHRKVVVCV